MEYTLLILMFGASLWLGLYLINRKPASVQLRFAGLSLVVYALAIAGDILWGFSPPPQVEDALVWLRLILLLLTLPLCFVTLVHLLRMGILSATLVAGRYVLSTAAILYPAGMILAIMAPDLSPGLLSWSAMGFGLALLGLVAAAMDSSERGERLLPDMFRSFDYSFTIALIFGGQVALVMLLATGVTFPMLVLLLGTIVAALAIQTFWDGVQAALDRVAFASSPRLRQEREELRAAQSALPRVNEALDLDALGEAQFAALTRRALSHFGDLPRLATSPLTYLPIVEARLVERGARDGTLERANELKALLAESIARLKPRDKGDFGTSDEWRYYNALYFPYVAGLKPYNRRPTDGILNAADRQALEWFRAQVPERTLYNWQTAATKLVAQDLREKAKPDASAF